MYADMYQRLYRESLSEVNAHIESLASRYRSLYNEDIRTRKMKMNIVLENTLETEEVKDCPICFESIHVNNMVTTACNHEFCSKCIKWILNHTSCVNSSPMCPMCRASMYDFKTKTKEIHDSLLEHMLGV
jgi:hypothetical protein